MSNETTSLGLRIDQRLEARLVSVAKAQGRSKSEVARDAVRIYVDRNDAAFRAEARRQSLNAAARGRSDDDAFWESVAVWNDDDGDSQLQAD